MCMTCGFEVCLCEPYDVRGIAKTIEPRGTSEILNRNDVIDFLGNEIERCKEIDQYHGFIEGIEMAINLIRSAECTIDDLILKYYVVYMLRDFTKRCISFGLSNLIDGMSHSWLEINKMEGEI